MRTRRRVPQMYWRPRRGCQKKVVDLGAGYGRMGLVIAKHYPTLSFWGVEYVAERVAEGNRVFQLQKYARQHRTC